MHNLGPRETLEKFVQLATEIFRIFDRAHFLFYGKDERSTLAPVSASPRGKKTTPPSPSVHLRAREYRRKSKSRAQCFPTRPLSKCNTASFSPRVNIVDWQTACKYQKSGFSILSFRERAITGSRRNGCESNGIISTRKRIQFESWVKG